MHKENKLWIVILIAIIITLIGALTEGYFSRYLSGLSIAILTVAGAYFVYLKEQDSKKKDKEVHFKSKLYNLLSELNSNIDIPQQYSKYLRDDFLEFIEKDEDIGKEILETDMKYNVMSLLSNDNSEEFLQKFESVYKKKLKENKKNDSRYNFYKHLLDNDKEFLYNRPVVTIEIEETILNSCISDLEFYGTKYQYLRNLLTEVKHSSQVFRANQKILLYQSGDSKYSEYAVFRALICHMKYSSQYRKRIRKVVKEIMKINKKIKSLNDFPYIKKEF